MDGRPDPSQVPEWLLRTLQQMEIVLIEDVKLSDEWKDAF